MESPSLPQHDPSPESRRQRVAGQDAAWPVTYERFEQIAFAPAVPPGDRPATASRWQA